MTAFNFRAKGLAARFPVLFFLACANTWADQATSPHIRPPSSRTSSPPASQPETAGIPIIRRDNKSSELPPRLERGYKSYQAGHLEAARQDYEAALRAEPTNPDVLHGLASIALRQGHSGDAWHYYKLALEADPRDAVALAASTDALAAMDPVAAEGRLKNQLTTQPGAAPLSFSLGNLYARRKRWAEAQHAYFNAVAADRGNPDYLFNLAVSLDHLGQPELAAHHYRQALDAASRQVASFPTNQARQRLQELTP